MIESGSARKYVLYAIGEIALVVIGILIALQINNWNQYRIDRVEERKILRNLMQEFESNRDLLLVELNKLQQQERAASKTLYLFCFRLSYQ